MVLSGHQVILSLLLCKSTFVEFRLEVALQHVFTPEASLDLGVAPHSRERPPLSFSRSLSHPLERGQGRPCPGAYLALS